MATRATTRKQIRAFVLIWTFITFAMGLATFLAITFTATPVTNPDEVALNVAIPSATNENSEDDGDDASPEPIIPSITPTEVIAVQSVPLTETSVPRATPEIVLTPLPEPTLSAIQNQAFQVGIQIQESPDMNPENQDNWLRSVSQDLRLGWMKQQVRWELMEPVQGEINWSILDLVIPSATKFNTNVMLSVVTAPDWSRGEGVDLSQHGPPANPQDYVNFVLAILERYPGQIHAIEVWNEQNLDREWTAAGGLSAAAYVDLLRQTYNAVKVVDPDIIIISGALSPTGLNDGIAAFDDYVYMDQLIEAGVLDVADCIGAHHNGINIGPDVRYNEVPNDVTALFRGPFDNPHHSWSFRSTLEGYANRIRSAGSDKKLCVTEFGWAVTEDLEGTPRGFEFANDNTLEEQAVWITGAMSNMEEWDFVWLAFIWNFNYGPQAGWDSNNDNVPYSLIGPGFSFRPAYDAIRDWQTAYLEQADQ